MRKVEFSLIGIVALSLALKSFNLPGSGILLAVTTLTLAFFYGYLGRAYFNNIYWKKIRKKGALDKVTPKHKLLATYTGLAVALSVISVLFQGNQWPYADVLTLLSVLALLPAVAACIYKIAKGSSNIVYRKSVQRAASYLFVAVCAYIYF